MRKIALLLVIVLIVLTMTACGGSNHGSDTSSMVSDVLVNTESSMVSDALGIIQAQVESGANSVVQEPSKTSSKQTQSKVTQSSGNLTPEAVVDLYMSYKSLWMENPEYEPMCGYGYCLIDLDFDGVLELIASLNDGSGRYSYNRYFRINQSKYKVEEFQSKREDAEGIDYYYMAGDSKLLKNKSTGKLFYLFNDFVRVGSDEGLMSTHECYLKNGTLYENSLFHEYWHPDYDNNDYSTEIREYQYGGKEVSKSQFDQKTKEFYNQHKDMNVTWKAVSGDEFDNASSSKQKSLLLNAYRAFSYSGFSFK